MATVAEINKQLKKKPKPTTKVTEELTQQREEAGRISLREREKRKSELMKQGLTEKQAAKQVVQERESGVLGTSGSTIVTPSSVVAARESVGRATPTAEEALTREMPTQVSLTPAPLTSKEGLMQIDIAERAESQRFDFISKYVDDNVKEIIDASPEGSQLQKFNYAVGGIVKGVTNAMLMFANRAIVLGKAGETVIGRVPVVGDLISGVLGDRTEIVQDVQSSIEAKNQMATSVISDVRDGVITPEDAFRVLDALETQVNDAERLIQHQIILSPEIRRNPGAIEDIETDLLEVRQELFRSRTTIAQMTLTGEINPEGAVFRLQELQNQLKSQEVSPEDAIRALQ